MLSLENNQETTTTTSYAKKVGVALACTALVGAATVLVASQSSSSEANNAMLLEIPTEFKGRVSVEGVHGEYKLQGDFHKYENDLGDWVIEGKATATGERIWGSTLFTLQDDVITQEQLNFLGKREWLGCFSNQRFPAYGQIPDSLENAIVVENFELDHDVQDRIINDCAADSTKAVMMWQNMPFTLCYKGGSSQSIQVFGKNFDARIVQDDTLDELYAHTDEMNAIGNCTAWDPLRTFEEVTAPHTAPKRVLKASTNHWPFQGHTEHSADKIIGNENRMARRALFNQDPDWEHPKKSTYGAHIGSIIDNENDKPLSDGATVDMTPGAMNGETYDMTKQFPAGGDGTQFTLQFRVGCNMSGANVPGRRELGEGNAEGPMGFGDWEPGLGMPPMYRAQLSQAQSTTVETCPQFYPETMRDVFEKAAAQANVAKKDFHIGARVDPSSNTVSYTFDTSVASNQYLAALHDVLTGRGEGREIMDSELSSMLGGEGGREEEGRRGMAEVNKLTAAMFSPSLDAWKDSRELPFLGMGGTINTPYPPIPTSPPTVSPPPSGSNTPYPQLTCYFVHGSGGKGMFQRSGGYCADDSVKWKQKYTANSVPATQYASNTDYHTRYSGLDIALTAAFVHTAGQQSCHTRPDGLYQNGHGNSARKFNPGVGLEVGGFEYKLWGGQFLWMSHDRPVSEWNDFPCNDVVTVDTDSRLREYDNLNYIEEVCNLFEWGRTERKKYPGMPAYSTFKLPRVHDGNAKHQFVITQSNGGPVVSQAFRLGNSGQGCDKDGMYFFISNPPLTGSQAGNFLTFACANAQMIGTHFMAAVLTQYPNTWMLAPIGLLLTMVLNVFLMLMGNTIMQGLQNGAYCAPNTLFQTSNNGYNTASLLIVKKQGRWWDPSLSSRSWPVFQALRVHPKNPWAVGNQPTQASRADAKLCGTNPLGMSIGNYIPMWGIATCAYLEEVWDHTCLKVATGWACSWRGCGWAHGMCLRRVGWKDNSDGMVPLSSCKAGEEIHLVVHPTNHEDGTVANGDGFLQCGVACWVKRALKEAKWKSNVAWCQYYGYPIVNTHNWGNNVFPAAGPCPCSAHGNMPGNYGYSSYTDSNPSQAITSCQ